MSAHCLFCGGQLLEGVCVRCGVRRDTLDEKRVGARCPRCGDVRLVQFALGPVALQACGRCQGSFLPATEWDNLLDTYQAEPLPNVVVFEAKRDPVSELRDPYREAAVHADEEHPKPNLDAPVSCPVCGAKMDRLEFGWVSNVFVDVCRLHGIWLDGGELAAVVRNAHDGLTLPIPTGVELQQEPPPRGEKADDLLSLVLRRVVRATRRAIAGVRE